MMKSAENYRLLKIAKAPKYLKEHTVRVHLGAQ